MCKRTLFVFTAIYLFAENHVYADPVFVSPVSLVGSPAQWSALGFEALLLAIILSLLGFHSVRVFCVWVPLTFVTFCLFTIMLTLLFEVVGIFGRTQFLEELPDYMLVTGFILAIVIGEVIIVFLEAWAMRAIFNRRFFRRRDNANLSLKRATGLSVLINVSSFLMGFVFLYLYDNLI
jgi:hypothetical protein